MRLTTHPSQHEINHSIHFIIMPKSIQLWEVPFNVVATFAQTNSNITEN